MSGYYEVYSDEPVRRISGPEWCLYTFIGMFFPWSIFILILLVIFLTWLSVKAV
jgi:hypothetical protein